MPEYRRRKETVTKINPELNYEKCKKLIRSRANKYARTGHVGIEYEDLVSAGNEIWVTCMERYNPSIKCSFTSFLYGELTRCFWQMIVLHFKVKKRSFLDGFEPIEGEVVEKSNLGARANFISNGNGLINSEKKVMLAQEIENLSDDSKYIIGIVMDMPDEMINHMKQKTNACRVSMRRIQQYLIDTQGWNIGRVWRSFMEIRKIL